MRYELKSVKIWSFTKVSFFINLPIGFMFGLLYALMLPLMLGLSEIGGFPGPAIDPSDFPFGIMLVVLPIMGAMFAAVFYTIAGVVLLAIYNLIVRMIGGLEFELDPVNVAPSASSLRAMPSTTSIGEAAVTTPPVYITTPPSGSPPPPPAVSGVAPTVQPAVEEPSAAPMPATPVAPDIEEPATILPELRPKPLAEPAETAKPPEPPRSVKEHPDDKTENDPPPSPGIS